MNLFPQHIVRQIVVVILAVICVSNFGVAQDKYKILVRSAKLKSHKSNGKDWDLLGNAADAYCVISIDGRIVFVSGKAKDTLTPRWWTGTEYWQLRESSVVEIKLIDADAGKILSRAGIAGIAMQPDLPSIGKRIINDQLLKTNTDDLIAHWKGTFGTLQRKLGLLNTDRNLAAAKSGSDSWVVNDGLDQLTLRLVRKDARHSVEATVLAQNPARLGISSCVLNETKNSIKMKWDVGAGEHRNPDLQYFMYVNGSPVVLGAKNPNTYVGSWNSPPAKLHLANTDLVAISITDSDAGTVAAQGGSIGIMFSQALSASAKQKLFEELSKASTDDQVFLWEGEWGKLKSLGSKVNLAALKSTGTILVDNGIRDLTIHTTKTTAVSGKKLTWKLGSFSVSSRKPNGDKWDLGFGKTRNPDPFAKVYISNSKSGWTLLGETRKFENEFAGDFSWSSGRTTCQSPQKIKIELYDDDAMSDDRIDTIIVPVPTTPSSKTLKSKSVSRLAIEFR